MKVSVKDKDYYKYDVIDLNTGCRIPYIQEADDENGHFTMILPAFGEYKFVSFYAEREIIKFKFKGNIKIVGKDS